MRYEIKRSAESYIKNNIKRHEQHTESKNIRTGLLLAPKMIKFWNIFVFRLVKTAEQRYN